MSIKNAIRMMVLAASVSASAALAQQYWAPPADIAPKNPVAVPPPGAPAAPAATAPAPVTAAVNKPAPNGEEKKAKAKDCAAQAHAKALRGAEHKKFQEQCKKS